MCHGECDAVEGIDATQAGVREMEVNAYLEVVPTGKKGPDCTWS